MFRLVRRTTLLFVAFSLPIQGYAIPIPGFPATPTKVVTAGLLALAALQLAQGKVRGMPDRKAVWIIAFAVSYAISMVSSVVQQAAPQQVILIEGLSMFSMLIYYFLLVFVIRDRDDLMLVLWGLILGGAITALPALLGHQSGQPVSAQDTRFEGLAGQANLLGHDMAVCIPISVALFMESRRRLRKLAAAGAGVLAIGGLLLSLSRAAMISAAAMWGLWVYWSGSRETLRFLPVALFLLVGVVIFSPTSVTDRLQTITNPAERAADASIQSRFEQLGWAFRAIASNPVVGVGTSNFPYWAEEQPGEHGKQNVIHDVYLSVAAEQGIFGLVPYLGILALTWFDFARTRRIARRERWRRDPIIRELGVTTMYLQLAFFATLIVALAHPSLKAKTMWLLIALSTVTVGLMRKRIAALAPQSETAPLSGLVDTLATPSGVAARSYR